MSNTKKEKFAIVFDWDDVVFRTAAFKEKLAEELSEEGISKQAILETFAIAKDNHGYNPAIHARMIVSRSGSGSAVAIRKRIWSECRTLAKKLLYPDAVRAIRAAARAGFPLYVLSAGRREFQKVRIYGSGLANLFEGIYIVDVTDIDAAAATKVKILGKLAKNHEKLLFLDDRHKTIAGVQEARELKDKVLALLVWRQKERPPQGMRAIKHVEWKEIKTTGEKFTR